MNRRYSSREEIGKAQRFLTEHRGPFRFEHHNIAPGFCFDALPVRSATDTMYFILVHDCPPFPNVEGAREGHAGDTRPVDFEAFQDLTWEPIEVDDYDWKQHLQ